MSLLTGYVDLVRDVCARCSVTFGSILSQSPVSVVNAHDSRAYRNVVVKRESINCTFDLRHVLLSLQTSFSFVWASAVCAIPDRISSI